MRTSLPASAGLSGSVHSSTFPLPLRSSMPLWLLARWLQIFSSPQYAEGSIGFAAAEAWKGGPNDSGALGSATGILKNVTLFVLGSRIAMLSVAYSGDP